MSLLDAQSIAALLPPPQNQPLGNAPPVIDDQRVTFPTTGEFLNYDAATNPPGQEPTWTPATTAPPTTQPPMTQPAGKTVIDLAKPLGSNGSNILWIGVCALIICILLAAAYWFLGNRGGAKSQSIPDDFPY